MKNKIPDFLYKYRSCNENSIKNLENNVVWCTTLNNMNDPYEGYSTVSFINYYKAFLKIAIPNSNNYLNGLDNIDNIDDIIDFLDTRLTQSSTEIKKTILERNEFLTNQHKNIREKIITNTSICSFAEEYNNALMWSHYADSHQGFCIEYKTEQMKKFLYKVKYRRRIYDITKELIGILNGKIMNFKRKKPHQIATQKDIIWRYEKEWRLINPIDYEKLLTKELKKENGYTFKLKPNAIYLGTNISDDYKEQLLEIAKTQGLIAKKMFIIDDYYKLGAETLLI